MTDIPLDNAMFCFNSNFNGNEPGFAVVKHPDRERKSDSYRHTVGACFSDWQKQSVEHQKLMMMIEIWHATAFYGVPVEMVHEAMLVVPEYRASLADDCLPKEYRNERNY